MPPKSSQRVDSQRRSRDTTPNRPLGLPEGSRDELAGTKSTHNHRKRTYPEDSEPEPDQETEESSPSTSPAQVRKHMRIEASQKSQKPASQKTGQQKTASQKTASQKTASQKTASQKTGQQKPASQQTGQQKPASQQTGQQKHASHQKHASQQKSVGTRHAPSPVSPPKGSTGRSISLQPANVSKPNAQAPIKRRAATQSQHATVNSRDENGDLRSRSNSSTTLAAGSHENSQSTQHGKHTVSQPTQQGKLTHTNSGDKGVSTNPSTVKQKTSTTVLSKTEDVAFSELNARARRYYITYLSNQHADEPVTDVFPGISNTSTTYKDAKYRVSRSYKNWKTDILKYALAWITRWMTTQRPERAQYLLGLETFRDIRNEIRAEYDNTWPESIFKFALDTVDFREISRLGHRFLRYSFEQLTIHSRMTQLWEQDKLNIQLAKYSREHLLSHFDALYTNKEFKDIISLDDFPERCTPRSLHFKRQPIIDINEDSDGASVPDDDEDECEVRRSTHGSDEDQEAQLQETTEQSELYKAFADENDLDLTE